MQRIYRALGHRSPSGSSSKLIATEGCSLAIYRAHLRKSMCTCLDSFSLSLVDSQLQDPRTTALSRSVFANCERAGLNLYTILSPLSPYLCSEDNLSHHFLCHFDEPCLRIADHFQGHWRVPCNSLIVIIYTSFGNREHSLTRFFRRSLDSPSSDNARAHARTHAGRVAIQDIVKCSVAH